MKLWGRMGQKGLIRMVALCSTVTNVDHEGGGTL